MERIAWLAHSMFSYLATPSNIFLICKKNSSTKRISDKANMVVRAFQKFSGNNCSILLKHNTQLSFFLLAKLKRISVNVPSVNSTGRGLMYKLGDCLAGLLAENLHNRVLCFILYPDMHEIAVFASSNVEN